MGIVREISPELDPVEFPDNMDEAAVDAFMAQRGRELRQGLIDRRQAQLAAETEGDEALAYREGKVSPWEFAGSVARELPQKVMRGTGQFLRGAGEYLATAPIPRERGEIAPEIVRENIRRSQRTPKEIDQEVEASMTRQLGAEMVAAAPERFPTLPGVRDTLASQVSGGIGSVVSLLPAGLTGPAAPFVGGAMYGLSAGEDFADDAEQVINSRIAEALTQGNTEVAADLERRKFDMKNMARAAGRGVGTLTQALFGVGSNIRLGKSQIGGIGARLAERMVPKSAPVAIQNAVRGAVEGGLTEAAQEGTEQILGNAAALAVYDPNRGIMDDVAQSVLVGGLTGKVVGGAFGSRGQNRDPLPASRAAVAGEVVPGTEIPQDIGAPDLTLEDFGDLLPVEEVVAPVPEPPVPQAQTEGLAQFDRSGALAPETPVPEAEPAPETPAVDSPTLSPATAAETPTAPETPASPAPSSSAEGVTGEKPKRTRKAKRVAIDDVAGIEAAVAPAPVVAPAPAIPPDDTAMEAATAASMAPGAAARVTTAPDEGIAESAAVDEEMTRATTRVPQVSPAQVGMPDEGIAPAQMAQPNPEPKAQSLTPKQYHKAINAWRAKEYGVPVSEVEENYSEESNKQDHWSAVNKFVERGGKLDSEILDSLDEEQIQYLQRSARASIPEGYLSPAVRAKNKAFEREMIDARKKGREEAKRVVPTLTESSKGKHFVRVVQNDGTVDLHVFDSEDQAGFFHGQVRSLGGVSKIGRAKGNSKTPLSKFVEQSKSIGSVNVIRHDKPNPFVTSAATPEPTIQPLPTELAEAIAADEAPDVFVENTVRKFGESERASAQSTKPNERQRKVIEQGKRIAAEKGWDWNKVKETARRQLGLNENFLKPDSSADQVFQMMREEDAAAAKRGQRTAEEMARIDAETKARRDKEAADKAEKEATQRRQAEEKVAESERQTAQMHDEMVAKLPKKWIASWKKAKTKKAKAKLLNEAMGASGTRNKAALTAALDRAQEPTITEAPAVEPPAAQAAEVSTPEAVKQSKPPMAPKAQKAYLLEKIDEAIATAPEGVAEKENKADEEAWKKGGKKGSPADFALARNKARFGTVTIEVPGDGTFEILNTQQSLKAFKDKAKKFPTGKTGPSDTSLPAKSQSRPATVGKSEKASFIESAKAFVSDGDKVVPTTRFIFSDKTKSVATDGKKLLVWDSPIGPEGFYTTEGKKTNESGRFLDYNAIISAPMNKVFKGLNTERLFNLVKQAMATVPDKRNAGTARSPKWVEQPRIVQIYRNQDGSIGVLAEGIDEAAYVHNVRKGSKLLTKLNGEQFLEIIQASRRMGSDKVDISFSSDDPQLGIVGVTWPDGAAYVMPMRGGLDSTLAESLTTGKPQPDILERALNAAIKATDRTSATFSDPFLIAAVGLPVLNAALRIVRRVYLKTRNLARAKRQGMRLIRRQLRTDPKADLPRIEEAFNQLVEGTAEKPGPDQIEAFQAADGTRRQKSRGLFTGDVTVDTDAEWQAGAERWINQFNGNIRRAFEAARSTDYATTGLNPAAQNYVFGRLLEMSEIAINAARNDVDMVRNINLQKEIADASRDSAAEAAKALGSRALVQKRILWMYPILDYRKLIQENQKRLPFPDVVADEVRTWLQESGRRAVQEMRNAMTDADKVFARELKTTVRDMRVVWRDVMTASVESQKAMRRKILEELVKAPELKGLSRQGYIDIANLLGKAWERERARIFAAEFRKQVPLPTVKEDVRRKLFTAIPDILKWANLGLLDNEAFRNAVAPKFGVAKFDGETAKKLNEMAQRAQKVGGVNRKIIIQDMYRLMQTEGGVRWQDLLRDYWYAAVLTALDTQIDNVLGIINGQMLTAMGMAMAKPEVRRMIGKAYTEGFGEAVRDFWPILTKGEYARSINFNTEQPNNTLEAVGASKNRFARMLQIGKYTSRFMEAINHINALSVNQATAAWALGNRFPIEHVQRYMMPSENVRRNAIAKAQAEGTRPDLMNKRVREIIQESIPVEVLLSAKEISDIAGFTNKPYGLLGIVYEMINKAAEKLPGLKLVTGTSFARFAFNSFNQSLNLVAPVALYRYYHSQPGRQDGPRGLKFGQEHRKLILAQAAFGTALATFAAALFLGDDDEEKDRFIDINGSFKSLPDNKRKQLLSEGRLPYSIRIGDTYVSYRQLPFGSVLAAIGELRDRQLFAKDEWDQESIIRKFGDGMAAGILTIKDAPAISSFTEFLGVANAYKFDPNEQIEKAWPRYLARLSGSFIPRALKQVDAWADPTIYKANTGHEFFVQQMPFARRTLGEGPVLNVLGEPVQVERYPWSRWIRTRKEDKAWSTLGELASKGVFMPVPVATVQVLDNGKRREMTPAESYRYQQRVGQAYRKFVEENAERLLRMKPDDANEFIKNRTEQIRERLRNTKGA